MERAQKLGHAALIDGLLRIHALEKRKQKLVMPIGVTAALCFMRGDIHSEIDRELHGRSPSVQHMVKRIEKATPPRSIRYMLPIFPDDEMAFTSSVYGLVDAEPEPAVYERIGLDGSSPERAWWQELHKDFARIDEAAGELSRLDRAEY